MVFFALAWLAGRALSDRWHWSQYLFWTPAWVSLLAAAGTLACWTLGRSPGRKGRRLSARWLLPPAACIAVSAWEWRIWRVGEPVVPAGSIRFAAWNPASDFVDDFAERVGSLSPAVVGIANRPARTNWNVIRQAVGGEGALTRWGRLSLVSRFRITRWAGASLAVTGSRPQLSSWQGGSSVSVDRGEALFAELDTTRELGRPIIVWFVDLPSDPLLFRQDVFSQARAALDAFTGPVFARNAAGLEQPTTGVKGFPAPDLVIGDFNTPRGSDSIRRLVGDMTDAHAAAGWGPALTWHRRGPIIGIDQAFVSAFLVPARYGVRDMGAGQHLAQFLDIPRRE